MNLRKPLATFGFLAVALVVLTTTSLSFSTGITRATGLTEEGCTCHAEGGEGGVPNPNVRLLFQLEGNPYTYEPGRTYALTVGAAETDVPVEPDSNQGGFNLHVSVGTLEAAEGWEEFIEIAGPQEATHTSAGDLNARTFNLTWTAPDATDEADSAIFTLFVNTVNGDFTNNEGDHWNGGVFVVLSEPGASLGGGADEIDPEHIGVNWLAHWVGIISFVAVIATLLIYYFVLKFGESVHTTDHRDRKEK